MHFGKLPQGLTEIGAPTHNPDAVTKSREGEGTALEMNERHM